VGLPLPDPFVFHGWIALWGPGSDQLQEEDCAQDRGADEVVNGAGIEEQNPGHGQGGALNPSQRSDQVSADSARKGPDSTQSRKRNQNDIQNGPLQQQADTLGRGAEHKGDDKSRQGVFPGQHGGLEGIAARNGRSGKGGEGRGRRDLGQHRIVEDEHMGGHFRDPQLDQGRRRHHGGDDVGGRDRQGQPQDEQDDRRENQGQIEVAAGDIDDDA